MRNGARVRYFLRYGVIFVMSLGILPTILLPTLILPTLIRQPSLQRGDQLIQPVISASGPISIVGDSQFHITAAAQNWSGSGTALDPYLIQNLQFIGQSADDPLLSITYCTLWFKIVNCTFQNAKNIIYIAHSLQANLSQNRSIYRIAAIL